MEQVDKNDLLQVRNFMSDLNKALSKYNIQITLSPEQEKLAINGVGRMDSRGKQEAIKLIVNMITTEKSTPESTIQKAVFIEHKSDKAFPYMLVAKVRDDPNDIGYILSQAAGQNKTFKIQMKNDASDTTTVTTN